MTIWDKLLIELKKKKEEFKEVEKNVEREQSSILVKLLVHYEQLKDLGKKFDEEIKKLSETREDNSLTLEDIKTAEVELEQAEQDYKDNKEAWLLEKALARAELKKWINRRHLK